MRPAGQFADLPTGVRLHYRVQGPPGGPWLVLINGLLSDTTMWAGVLPGLTRRFRVLTFDCRGQGKSEAPLDGPYPVSLMAADLWALLESLDIRSPWLAGLSNGSSIALQILATHPGSFRGAVLTSAMPRTDFSLRLRLEHWARCLELGGTELQFDAVAPYLWGDRFIEARYQVLKAYHASTRISDKPFHGLRHQIDGALPWDIRSRLSAIQEPVLCLAGAEDLLTPPWKCLEVAQGLPNARFEVVPGVGHAYPVEDPVGYVDKIMNFISN
ncbi:alpha/beta fold hydrolase [Mesoterricola sediminis]|uniref:Aminoacrylate hydrolase RutD n=1 Tax=Mesoterricola sediminis TaxID=2927980 RepID=A0AA48GS72_9BACT|nr:alpha/beta fold hydrolase [Mesoterricola sediminis]BDU76659.1 putative aminoacrylate hydrolase RutD [Mesoterricola sediminis]